MADFLPPENNAISSLLAVIADPKRAQARLDDLNKQQAAINSRFEEARKAELTALKAKEEADRTKAEIESIRDQMTNNLDKMQASYQSKLEALDKSWNEHQAEKAAAYRDLENTDKVNKETMNALSAKATELGNREIDVTRREQEAEERFKEYNDKLSKLKAIM